MSCFYSRILLLFLLGSWSSHVTADTKQDKYWRKIAHPILAKHCTSCHNAADKKAGIDFDLYYYVPSVIGHGEMWQKAVEMMQQSKMPPSGQPRMSDGDRDALIGVVNSILDSALAQPDPGPPVLRRLSHREYGYTIRDLLDLDFDAMAFFPKEGSGGEGFDNQGRVLFMTPLLMERYYMAADSIVKALRQDEDRWNRIAENSYRPGLFRKVLNRIKGLWSSDDPRWEEPRRRAQQVIIPFATKTFRGFLSQEDRTELIEFFDEIYFSRLWKKKDGFDQALATVFKRVLVSPMFLYRSEVNLPIHKPYAISNLELASRLSYLLWTSMPDDILIQVAYREDLHDPKVLSREARRMMKDMKFRRFAQSFAPQWLGVEEPMSSPHADQELFPEFTSNLQNSMRQEVIDFFYQAFCVEKNALNLIAADYTMLDESLAKHYEIPNVQGPEFRKVQVTDYGRGGVLGMGAVLTSTSLSNRTSPVLRGQWVLEQVMGTPAPPPPPDVPELNEEEGTPADELDLRALLELHRAAPNCAGCHNKMDPIGFAMENFDAIGRWRQHYRGEIQIDASVILENGRQIEGPIELKKALVEEKEKFAENLSRKVMSYALGRGVVFADSPTWREMKRSLLESNFNSEDMMLAMVNSYPFRHRQSDMTELYIKQ